MNRLTVVQCDDAQIPSQIGHIAPVAYASIGLYLCAKRTPHNLLTPFYLDVRTLPKNLFPKIARRFQSISEEYTLPLTY